MSSTETDALLWEIKLRLIHLHGCTCDDAGKLLYPLAWYIHTGRASAAFLRAVASIKPFLLARDLAKGGTDEEALARVFRRIGWSRP